MMTVGLIKNFIPLLESRQETLMFVERWYQVYLCQIKFLLS